MEADPMDEVEQEATTPEPAPQPAPKPAAEATPESEPDQTADVTPPEWMRRLMYGEEQQEQPQSVPAQKPPAPPQPLAQQMKDSVLSEEDAQRVDQHIQALIDARVAELKRENEELRRGVGQYLGRDVQREVAATMEGVYKTAYNGVFKNDPTYRSNPKVADMANALVEMWCGGAKRWAEQTGDTSNLAFARTPVFARAALAMVKAALGADGSPSVEVAGGEVESTSTGARTGKARRGPALPKLSKSERAEMERMGVSDAEIEEALALRAKMGLGDLD